MRFEETPIPGVVIIEAEPIPDHRGLFARVWGNQDFLDHGLVATWSQGNVQHSPTPGTLRGMHYQLAPHDEVKLVRCTRGRIYDVAVDLRIESPTYLTWFGTELTADDYRSVWIPRGCAHGFLSLDQNCEVLYLTSKPFAPEAATGVRYDDPSFGIEWPAPIRVISERDGSWPLFD